MSSYLIIFDIDGTLTNTLHIDKQCYHRALADVFNLELSNEQRALLQGSADSGLIDEICVSFLKKVLSTEELTVFKDCFFRHLETHLPQYPNLQIKGASNLLQRLQALPNVQVAIATGAWRESALLKLRHAKIDIRNVSLTTANDGKAKADILEVAYRKMQPLNAHKAFYVGDRHFDYHAAKVLDLGFVGVGGDEVLLQHVSSHQCLSDLEDFEKFLKLISYE